MNSEQSIVCPSCGAVLPASGLEPGAFVQCSRCGKQFNLGTTVPTQQRTSGKAVASLVLGLLPIPLLTGIPAIILGIWALMDIKRYAGQLRGTGAAATGIIFGSLCTFVCTPTIGVVAYYTVRAFQQMELTKDPDEAAVIASDIAEFEAPEGLQPILGGAAFGGKMAIYGDRPDNPNSMIMLMKFPAWMAASQAQMQQQMQQQMQMQGQQQLNVQATKVETFTIRGQPVQVNVGVGKDAQTSRAARQYMALIPGDTGPIMILVIAQDPAESDAAAAPETEDTAVRLSEEQVKKFFESIQ
jgi:Domain of unknown function (DUF4190)